MTVNVGESIKALPIYKTCVLLELLDLSMQRKVRSAVKNGLFHLHAGNSRLLMEIL
jgi:hypothetical protein